MALYSNVFYSNFDSPRIPLNVLYMNGIAFSCSQRDL
jgi:hypothetical protein